MENKILTELPKHNKGANKGSINWKEVQGIVQVLYSDKVYKIEVLSIINRIMTVKYNDITSNITINNFSTLSLGNILGIKTSKYKYNIGDIIETKTGNIKVLEYIRIEGKNNKDKGYLVQCLKCKHKNGNNFEFRIRESDIKRGIGCPCCSNTSIIEGINDISTTHPDILVYFCNKEEVKNISHGNDVKRLCKCPYCGNIKRISTNTLTRHGFGCVCSDGFSFASKFIFNILQQLNIDVEMEYNDSWCKGYRYDFYLNLYNILIEANGLQHYEEGFSKIKSSKTARTLKEEQENDEFKKELALDNGIKTENYIVIDCRKSELSWIKDNIIASNLNKLFDLSKIDWKKAEKFAVSNRVKEACDLWNSGIHSTKEIGEIMKIHQGTISNYLTKGNELFWCKYDSKSEIGKAQMRKIRCKQTGEIFNSILECEINSEIIFGVKLYSSGIIATCKGKSKLYKNYSFEYVA